MSMSNASSSRQPLFLLLRHSTSSLPHHPHYNSHRLLSTTVTDTFSPTRKKKIETNTAQTRAICSALNGNGDAAAVVVAPITSTMATKGFSIRNRKAFSSVQLASQQYDNNGSSSSRSSSVNQDDHGRTERMNLFTAINNAMSIAMKTDDTAIVFGEDVAFGGVFRCSQNLKDEFGPDRVFNTPLSENGIAGFAIGYASMGGTAIGEIQFADYIFPAFDQIVNEMAKFRYRSGNQWNCGGVTLRSPCGAVGHGGHYHSQSPEAYLAHTPGLTVVMPRGPIAAKGLLLSSIRSKDPVIFLEPKALYRAAVEDVPVDDYEWELGKAQILRKGNDITVIGWGGQLQILQQACDMAEQQYGVSCELIDLQTIVPWDIECVVNSVQKTGKCLVSHEAPMTCGFGSEIASTVQEHCFFHLQSPIKRICGYDTPFPLIFEKYYVPNVWKNLQAIHEIMIDAK